MITSVCELTSRTCWRLEDQRWSAALEGSLQIGLDFMRRARGSDHKDGGALPGVNRQPVSARLWKRPGQHRWGGGGGDEGGGRGLSMQSKSVAAGCPIQMVASDIFFKSAMMPTKGGCCFGMATVCPWVHASFCGRSGSLCTQMMFESWNTPRKQQWPLTAWNPWRPLCCSKLWRKELVTKLLLFG